MDPHANIAETLDIAHELERASALADEFALLDPRVERLAELVIALDEWRTKGGFDPYADPNAPVADPQANSLLARCKINGVSRVFAKPPGAGLPDDYVLVIENTYGPGFECGIAPDGCVSS